MATSADAKLLARWDKLMVAVERPYAVAIVIEKNRYIMQAAETFKLYRTLEERDFDYHASSMIALAERFMAMAVRIAVSHVLSGKKAVLPELEHKEAWHAFWTYLVHKWMSDYGAARAKETAHTTREDLQRVITAAVSGEDELNPVQVAAAMLRVKGLSAFRAMTIARTEVHNAMMYASQESAAKLEREGGLVLKKRWVPVLDERTRVNHASMANVAPIALDADFMVGGERMQRPGDPRGSAANTVRCRCVLAFSAED